MSTVNQSNEHSHPIRLIVGLGNVGAQYEKTRHNAGFWFVDEISASFNAPFKTEAKFHGAVASFSLQGQDVRLLKPSTLMNCSGRSVSALAKFYKIPLASILIAHDELDLDAGISRLKFGGGHGGHNGLRDIIPACGGKDFWRLRVGIGHPGHKSQVSNYVLHAPSKVDKQAIDNSLFDASRVLDSILAGDMEAAMRSLHTR